MKKYLITFSLMLFLNCLHGQNQHQVFSSNGNSFTNSSISVSWTIGEIFTESIIKSNYTLNQGFHQNLNKIESGLLNNSNLNFKIFPNPVVDQLTIETSNSIEPGSTWMLVDLQGRTVLNNRISDQIFTIDLSNITPGLYFFRILTPDNQLSSISKLIKN